jgi:subtilisin family serine protease
MKFDTKLLDLMRLTEVMRLTQGRPEILIAIIDGPVDTSHAGLAASITSHVPATNGASCRLPESSACAHGTMVAGILFARRDAKAPAICPNCSIFLRTIYGEKGSPSASSEEVAEAIIESVNAGAHVINLSAGISGRPPGAEEKLSQALSFAARHGTIVVAAAGNQSSIRGSWITQHPWVIPVVSCDGRGFVSHDSNLSFSIGRRGITAPGQNVVSLAPGNASAPFSGTSAACAFVSGAVALLWSENLNASAAQIKWATLGNANRASIAPPLVNAWEAWHWLQTGIRRRRAA